MFCKVEFIYIAFFKKTSSPHGRGFDGTFFFQIFEFMFLTLQVEAELTELIPEERIEYLTSLGVKESGLGNLIRATYSLLGLRTYFTSGEKVK